MTRGPSGSEQVTVFYRTATHVVPQCDEYYLVTTTTTTTTTSMDRMNTIDLVPTVQYGTTCNPDCTRAVLCTVYRTGTSSRLATTMNSTSSCYSTVLVRRSDLEDPPRTEEHFTDAVLACYNSTTWLVPPHEQ